MENWNNNLITAARTGDIAALKLCLQNNADIDYKDNSGYSVLMWAAWEGQLEVCRILLKNRCEKDNTDKNRGETALHLAAFWGHLQVTKCLVEEASISPLVKTNKGKTPYDISAEKHYGQYKEVMEYLQVIEWRSTQDEGGGNIKYKVLKKICAGGSVEQGIKLVLSELKI